MYRTKPWVGSVSVKKSKHDKKDEPEQISIIEYAAVASGAELPNEGRSIENPMYVARISENREMPSTVR